MHSQDMAYKHSGIQNLFRRGTIVFYVKTAEGDRQYTLTKSSAARTYHEIRQAWTEARLKTPPSN